MKKFKIIGLTLLLLIVATGIVYASEDISNFKSPEGFDDGIAGSMDKDDFSITIDEFDKDLNKDLFNGQGIQGVSINGTFAQYNDTYLNEVGARELIKIGKTDYTVQCKYDGNDNSKVSECIKYLEDFNKKNNLKPLNLTKMDFGDGI